VDLLTC